MLLHHSGHYNQLTPKITGGDCSTCGTFWVLAQARFVVRNGLPPILLSSSVAFSHLAHSQGVALQQTDEATWRENARAATAIRRRHIREST